MKSLVYHKGSNNKTLLLAEHWHELTSKQFIQATAILHSEEPAEIKMQRLLFVFCNKGRLAFSFIPFDIRLRMLEHIEWALESQQITRQLIPVYKGFYGPESDFDNIVLSEFHHSESAYYHYAKTGEVDALNSLVAVLYRLPKAAYDKKQNRDGDIRRPFAAAESAFNKKKIARWDINVKLAILLWYDSCRQALVKLYPTAFGGAGAGDDYFQGLYKMIRSLSGDKYGTFNQVEGLPLHTAFMEIITSLEEAEELKRRSNL